MKDNAGSYYVIDDSVRPSEENFEVDSSGGKTVYEVIRIIDRVPLFFEDHYKRLQSSMQLLGMKLGTPQKEFKRLVQKAVDANGKTNCNVRAMVFEKDGEQRKLLYISKSYYPDEAVISEGVRVGIFSWERNNPNAKLDNTAYKKAVAKAIQDSNSFEVLLVNAQDKITEGSRSNVFFVKGNKVYTTPEEYILKGVTRKYILDVCRKLGIEVIETLIGLDTLEQMEGLFLSGTSIKVLPISDVDGKRFESPDHPTIVSVRDTYNALLKQYIAENI